MHRVAARGRNGFGEPHAEKAKAKVEQIAQRLDYRNPIWNRHYPKWTLTNTNGAVCRAGC
jgi:hypothetical protein